MRERDPVSRYMTPALYTVGVDQPLNTAHELMHEHRIRHLPVMDQGRLVGLVSQRDLYLVERFAGVDPTTLRVGKAMQTEPFTVAPEAPVAEVAEAMAQRKAGSAIVVSDDRIAGIFTTTDALRALATVLARVTRRQAHGRRTP